MACGDESIPGSRPIPDDTINTEPQLLKSAEEYTEGLLLSYYELNYSPEGEVISIYSQIHNGSEVMTQIIYDGPVVKEIKQEIFRVNQTITTYYDVQWVADEVILYHRDSDRISVFKVRDGYVDSFKLNFFANSPASVEMRFVRDDINNLISSTFYETSNDNEEFFVGEFTYGDHDELGGIPEFLNSIAQPLVLDYTLSFALGLKISNDMPTKSTQRFRGTDMSDDFLKGEIIERIGSGQVKEYSFGNDQSTQKINRRFEY